MLIDKDTDLYCSFAKKAGSTGCAFHNFGFNKLKINALYKSFSVENVEEALMAMRILNIKGAGITMPFKKEVLKLVDVQVEPVSIIGSANTIINNDGILEARNTDWMAARDFLTTYNYRYKRIYILGNGGYANAVRYACDFLNFPNKTITRKNWNQLQELTDCIVFNCTPVEDIKNILHSSVQFIDCLVSTETGKQLADLQASYQFKLYTGLEFPVGA